MHEDEWGSAKLDMNAYLSRIGHPVTTPTMPSLQRAHVLAMPWNNLDMVLRRPVQLDIESVQEKLLIERRGGTCSEHTILFAAALTQLGYRVTGMSGRVQLGSTSVRPATHGLLRVAGADRVWLCDVGFGGSPLEPIELADGAESVQDDWHYRVTGLDRQRNGQWC
ncbi:arylamine N-acetyltransferase family protein [Streptosporangium sp. G11]|uniref:arylamine N-acetyltransferase family protein n=1 Tax=Streptosporangium sp. G11 TaxID=3436926 RepID=UPI003EBB8E3C